MGFFDTLVVGCSLGRLGVLLCLLSGGMCIALVRGDAEPILITRQVILEPRTVRITVEGPDSDKLNVVSYRLTNDGTDAILMQLLLS